ncbi:MAG: T9SS type A sorting domain-containing protein [Polaribacter sp.]|uniref:T9SS type A sorting domain-containing protein n=1 Tax=Polaribacter sp. TaxID=1920175 RepID=UPI00326659F7
MKKNYSLLLIIFILFVFVSCQQNDKTITLKKIEAKKTIKKDKKGIEHIADYQNQIRKRLGAENNTYEKGYLITEYNKAKQALFAKKSSTVSIVSVFTERGPFNVPGRSRGIAIDPNNKNRWYVGSVGGGVWLTEDDGLTWSNLTDFKIPNLSTSTIVISETDPNTLYVGTGEPFGSLDAVGGAGVFKTIDGGTTWQHLTSTTTFGSIGRIIINPADKNHVVIGTTTGIYLTTDGGVNWSPRYVSSNAVQDLDADPSNFNIQYGSVNGIGIVKSIDGGLTWTLVFDKLDYNSNHSRFETSVSLADPNTVFLSVFSSENATVGVNSDFYVSRDKGVTFTSLGTEGSASDANLLTGQGWYNNVIMGHPYNANVFYVGGVAIFKVTINGDKFTFTSIASGYDEVQINSDVHVDQHGLFSNLGSNQEFRILLANDGGVYSTTMNQNPGANAGNWTNAVKGKNSTQFYGAAKQNGEDNYLAGAQDNGSWIALDNNADKNKDYIDVLGGDGFEAIWHYNKPQDFIVTSQTNYIARYVNFSGALANFSESSDSSKSPFYTKIANADNNPNVVFAISSSGVWRSTNFAETWNLTPITSGFTPGAVSALNVKVSTADPNVIWAGAAMTESGSYSLFVSKDNGETFSKTNTFTSPEGGHNYYISGLGTSHIDKNRAYVLFSSQGAAKVLKTENLGESWTDISGISNNQKSGFPDVAVHSILEMPFDERVIWVGTDIGIFETSTAGLRWSLVTEFPSVAVYDMKVVNDQVVIATHGRGIWSATIPELNSYILPAYLTFAEVTTKQKGIDSRKIIVSYKVPTDNVSKIKFFIDDIEQAEIIQDFSSDLTYTYETNELSEGYHKLGVQVFDETNNLQTSIKNQDFVVIDFENSDSNITISDFKDTDVFVYDSGFKVDDLDGQVSGNVLNNMDHPYENNKTYTAVLKKPLTISEGNKNFFYEDLAIVEPYTDSLADITKFYDYVIIEASTDLKTWKTLDKYDARRFPEWLTEFNKGGAASASDALFKTQNIILTDKDFSVGETIVIRFKLVSDPGANSFGWAIRSINTAVASIDNVLSDKKAFTVYPTISDGSFTIFAKNTLGKSKMRIFNINGKQVYNSNLDFNSNEKQEISVSLTAGVYIVNLLDENNKKSSNKIIIE